MRQFLPFLTFFLGAATASAWNYIAFRSETYLDQKDAIAFAAEEVRIQCLETKPKNISSCVNFTINNINESKDGWTITFIDKQKEWSDSVFIGRRGEYDALGGFLSSPSPYFK